MKIADVLSPVDGVFSHMPTTIWGADFDPTMVDIELHSRLGGLGCSPTMRHYVRGDVLDTKGLADLLYQRYHRNWARVWDALVADYDLLLTSTSETTRTLSRDVDDLETRNLSTSETGTVGRETATNGTSVKTGSIDRTDDSTLTRNLTDKELRDTKDATTESGKDTTTDTHNTQHATTSSLTKAGSEKTTGSDTETRDLTTQHTGTQGWDETESNTGTGSTTTENGLYGVGSTGLAKQSQAKNSETRDFTDMRSRDEVRNLSEKEAGTVGHSTNSTLSFTGRTDSTDTDESHTGTVRHDTDRSGTSTVSGTGTVTNTATGTEGTTGTASERYSNLTDSTTGGGTDEETRNLRSTDAGTVGSTHSETLTESERTEGSSPLRTYQALIAEEIEGRTGQAWSFTDLVIRDVQTIIASRIWKRGQLYV